MFWKRKKQQPVNRLVKFLENADDAYILAFKSKNIKPFVPFASPDVLNRTLEKINSRSPKCFGISKYRNREWTVKREEDSLVIVLKDVTHGDISLNNGIYFPIADDERQIWTVAVLPGDYQITKIEAVGGIS